MHQIRSIFCVISVLVPVAAANANEPTLRFVATTIDGNVGKVCYAVTTADVDNDGKRDIVAVTENRVLWYQNPSWKMHVIIEDQTPLDNVC
ncbi:MAG: VCBS repeat-containing protein, partial [Fuerstiella sp.]